MVNESIAATLKDTRSELMTSELESVALRLFEAHGYTNVTVEEIAAAAEISVRTFYRYFPSKDLLLQVRVDRRSTAVRDALAARPSGEALMTSLRVALSEATGAEDPEMVRRWITVVASSPDLIRGALGGIQLKVQGAIAEFIASRMNAAEEAFASAILAGAVGGAVQAALRHWYAVGGDLSAMIAESLELIEHLGTETTLS